MRIALICDWYAPRPGGMEAHLTALAEHLIAAGHSIHVITSTPGPGGTTSGGPTVHRLSAPRVPWAGVVFQPAAIREIGDILQREHIELTHAHVSIVAPVGIGGAYEAQRLGLPTVVTFHSFIPATPLWAWIVGRLVGAAGWQAQMTAVSSLVAREVGTFAPEHHFQILPNAIDTDFWTPGAQRRRHDTIRLVAVTRLRSKKRPMILLDAMRAIQQLVPRKRVLLQIAGSGPLEAPMRRRIQREGLATHVEFVGWQSPTALRSLLRDSDGFLLPTVRESFGLAALEARAVGLPVVAMRRSAIADFIVDGESGLLASSDSDFVNAAVRLVRDDAVRMGIAENNRRVKTGFSWDRAVRLHESVYSAATASARL